MNYTIKQIDMYECPHCGIRHASENQAERCLVYDVNERTMNDLFRDGLSLGVIYAQFNVAVHLSEAQFDITEDSCFVISYLQCCDNPAYRIMHITPRGDINVGGCGSWSGYYRSNVRLDCLKDPRPAGELFVDPR